MKRESALVPGEVLDVAIEKAVYRGVGLARHEGQVVFVNRGLPGERLRVRVVAVERGYVRAAVEERLAPSPADRPSPCPAFPQCGGCSYQSLDYAAQLALKVEMLRESLHRARVQWSGPIDVTSSPEQGWRTRASFHVAARDGHLQLGLFEEGSRRIVDLTAGCPQVSSGMNGVLGHLRAVLAERPLLAAQLKHLHLAESHDGSERVASLEGDWTAADAAALARAVETPRLTGIGASIGPEAARRFVMLAGSPYIHSDVLGARLRSHARAFFQGNRFLVEALAGEVSRLLAPGRSLLDLYGGVGLFGLTAGRDADDVVVVEGGELSATDAEENARQSGLGAVRVVQGDVGDVLARLPIVEAERVIVDPPRAGLTKRVVAALGERKPETVVYVSCDPATLARDLRAFETVGLMPDSVRAFDLFPDTFHIETVVRLGRK